MCVCVWEGDLGKNWGSGEGYGQIMMNRLMGTILLNKHGPLYCWDILGVCACVCMYVRASEQIEGCLCSP